MRRKRLDITTKSTGAIDRIVCTRTLYVFAVVALAAFAMWRINLGEAVRMFRDVRYEWLALAFVVYLAARAINAWEWRILLTKVGHAPLHGLLGALLIGTFVNAIAPANLGDVVRLQVVANRYALPRAGLIAERGSEALVNAMMFVLVALLSVFVAGERGAMNGGWVLWALVFASALAFTGAVAASKMLPRTAPQLTILWRLPHRLQGALQQQWPRIHDGFEVLRRPGLLLVLLVVGLAGWTIDFIINWSYGSAFNLDVPFSAYLSITLTLAVITTVPVTFGNIGVWEASLVGVLALYGVPADSALAYAVGSHIFVTVFNVGLGLAAMALMRIRPRDILGIHGSATERDDVTGGQRASGI